MWTQGVAVCAREGGEVTDVDLLVALRALRDDLSMRELTAGQCSVETEGEQAAIAAREATLCRMIAGRLDAILRRAGSPQTELEEAPVCEQHGTMVARDEMGREWHCAVCGAVRAGSEPPQAE